VKDGFILHGVDNDLQALTDPNSENIYTTLYLESASSKLDIGRANLGSFDKFTGRLKFDYAGSLKLHISTTSNGIMKDEESANEMSKKEAETMMDENDENDDNEEEGQEEGEEEDEEGDGEDDDEGDGDDTDEVSVKEYNKGGVIDGGDDGAATLKRRRGYLI